PPGDLRLARPLGFLTLLRVERRAMQGEPRIPPQVRALVRPGIDPNLSSPSANSHSMPEIRGPPPARNVAIVLCLPASNSRRTSRRPRAANSGSACSTSFHAAMAALLNDLGLKSLAPPGAEFAMISLAVVFVVAAPPDAGLSAPARRAV